MRRGATVRLIVLGLAACAVAFAVAFFGAWFPEEASVEADRINKLFWFTTAICIGIFGVVTAVVLYAVWKFRAAPDDDSDGPPIHGHTKLEIWWTAIPTVLVIAIGLYSAVVLSQNEDEGDNPLLIEVTGQQFAWSFKYPNQGDLVSTDMRLPLDQPVRLLLRAQDVIHSFWVPQFAQKQDAVPGITTELVITPKKLGTYPVVCTELCGLGHATMRSEVQVVSRGDFDAWVAERRSAVEGGGEEAGKAVFAENGCGGCHAFTAGGDKRGVGPDLGDLSDEAKRAGQELEEFIRSSIVEPGDYVEPGYPNSMPPAYGQLPKDQLDALVQYLVEGAK